MVYEYKCRVCGREIEIRQGILEDPEGVLYCPFCERIRPVKRLISRSSFLLSGKGWANDGYANKKDSLSDA